MSASLVGSEMCIRDRAHRPPRPPRAAKRALSPACRTHRTAPIACSRTLRAQRLGIHGGVRGAGGARELQGCG
eukprot:10079090-Alexandrium_andersonii.AAC.1